jgi:hypothetical protein
MKWTVMKVCLKFCFNETKSPLLVSQLSPYFISRLIVAAERKLITLPLFCWSGKTSLHAHVLCFFGVVDGIVDIFIDFLGHFTLILFCNENWHV